jgi:hypothetical protein
MIEIELDFASGVLGDENKEIVRGFLREGVSVVTFIKVDGTERVMRCTLMSDLIPSTMQESKSEVARPNSDTAARVFDTEKNGWRSFRWDSVRKVVKVD